MPGAVSLHRLFAVLRAIHGVGAHKIGAVEAGLDVLRDVIYRRGTSVRFIGLAGHIVGYGGLWGGFFSTVYINISSNRYVETTCRRLIAVLL